MNIDALLAALRARPALAGLTRDTIAALPSTGTAHGHARLGIAVGGRPALARIAYAHPGDPTAAARLETQAAAFRHLEPLRLTPALLDIVPPSDALPGGALIVEAVDGRAPAIPGELPILADTLAAIHAAPLPAKDSPIPVHANPFLATLEIVERNAALYLDAAVPTRGARAEIADELRLMRGMSLAFAKRQQPRTVALADTHPGNFLVDPAGKAWFVDLEKVHVGSPAIDLAHCTLPSSVDWHPDIGVQRTARADIAAFYARYLGRVGARRADALRPWLMPMRRLTWLRTTMFFCRWRVETRGPRDPANPSQWSDAGLDPRMKSHIDARIDDCFSRETIWRIRAEWMGPDPLQF